MVAIVRLKTAHEALPAPGQRVLKAADYALLREARELLAQAHHDAQALRDSAQAELDAHRQRGYAQGLAEAKREGAELMLETVGRSVDYLGQIENQIIDLLLSVVRKLLGTFDDAALTAGLARNALQVLRTQKQVTLRVPPDQEEEVRARLREILAGYSSIGMVDVVPDQRLRAGGCLLESALGVIDAGLDTQLAAIEQAMRAVLGVDDLPAAPGTASADMTAQPALERDHGG